MEIEKSKTIFLSCDSIIGPITIEGLVESKDPKDIRIADLPANVTYSVSSVYPILSIKNIDNESIEFVFQFRAIVNHGYLYWDDVISRYGHAFVWMTEHCNEMITMNLSVDINDSVILQCVVVFEEDTLTGMLEQVALLLNELAHRFRVV